MEGGFFVLGRIINAVIGVESKSNPPYRLTSLHLNDNLPTQLQVS